MWGIPSTKAAVNNLMKSKLVNDSEGSFLLYHAYFDLQIRQSTLTEVFVLLCAPILEMTE